MEIQINNYIPVTSVEGIGKRFAIWVQGCSLHCKNCANTQMWNFDGGTSYNINDFVNIIKAYKDKIEGITWLGGEPLEQVKPVAKISEIVQNMGLSVILFTGYQYSSIKDNEEFKKLINYVDILIDGKYEEEKRDYSRPWVGSSNQNYYFLTNRYNKSILNNYKNKVEIRILPDKKIIMSGMGNFEDLKELMR